MSTCKHCGQAKGKRYCEALQGDICSLCCGQHRGKKIKCPADCTYFAGRGRTAVAATPESFHRLWDAVEEYVAQCRERVAEAAQTFGEVDSEGTGAGSVAQLVTYAFCSAPGLDGERLVDKFDRERGWALPADVRAALAAVKSAWFSIFEVERIDPERGLKLLDRLTGESVYVDEESATRGRTKYDLLGLWVGACAGRHIIVGAGFPLPPTQRHSVVPAAQEEFKRLRRLHPRADVRELQRELVPMVNIASREATRALKVPDMRTTDGEDMLFCKAVYRFSSALARLSPATPASRCVNNSSIFATMRRCSGRGGIGRTNLAKSPSVTVFCATPSAKR